MEPAQHSAEGQSPKRLVIIPESLRGNVELLWDYHNMHHELSECDVGIGVGSHDLGVAVAAVQLFRSGMFPLVVFTGANSPTTIDRFPRGEAVHYAEHAIANGLPSDKILIETEARNTSENLTFTRNLLQASRIVPRSVMLMSRPYQQRRLYATCGKVWPEVDVICTSLPMSLDAYVSFIGDAERVINMLVGDTQRIVKYAEMGFAIPQDMPSDVATAFDSLVQSGYTSRLI